MRRVLCILFGATLATAAVNEYIRPLDTPIERMGAGRPSFTSIANYNSYDFAQSPLGFLEKEDGIVKLRLSHRLTKFSMRDEPDSLYYKSNSFYVPNLLLGKPGIIYINLYYSPTAFEVRDFYPATSAGPLTPYLGGAAGYVNPVILI